MKEKVFEFLYNSDTFEGGHHTESIHRTRKGAEMAMGFHRDQVKNGHNDLWRGEPKEETPPYNYDKWWGIIETELKD